MGLQEKRKQQQLETDVIPATIKAFKEIFDGDVEINIDWDSFGTLESIVEIEHQILGRIVDATRAICTDDLGKEAMKESLKSISVGNVDSSDNKQLSFSDGTLVISENWKSIWYPEDDIRKVLEEGL